MTDDVSLAVPAIETVGLTKRFGSHTAVDSVGLAVPHGSVFGFLGPNGSGKTTTIRMLLGLAGATAGEIRVLGEEMPRRVSDVLPRVGALVEGPAFYPFLSGAANLARLDSANRHASPRTRRDRVAEALDRVGLSHASRKRVKAYSLGMKQRLGLANALLTPRELLVLDEPTNGLDPQGTREVRNLIRSLADGGTTVFVSSHLLAEIEQICTHAAIMSNGSLVAQGTLADLRRAGTPRVEVRTPDSAAALQVLSSLGLQIELEGEASRSDVQDRSGVQDSSGAARDTVVAAHTDGTVAPEEIAAALVGAGVRIRGFTVTSASLEERFVALTGEGFDVAE